MAAVETLVVAAESVNWHDVAAVRLLGAVGGALLLIFAIRSMFGKRK